MHHKDMLFIMPFNTHSAILRCLIFFSVEMLSPFLFLNLRVDMPVSQDILIQTHISEFDT